MYLLLVLVLVVAVVRASSTTVPCAQRGAATCVGACKDTFGVVKKHRIEFYYGCQSLEFCNFAIGSPREQHIQCLHHRKTCTWTGTQCISKSGSGSGGGGGGPVAPPTYNAWLCNNGCFTAYDGICDDGGPNSSDGWCPYGSDCADCGPR